MTGGASASDEYVELTNRSSATVDLAALELVYVTSSGTTVTRKASWTGPRPLDPGQHLLVANVAGIVRRLGRRDLQRRAVGDRRRTRDPTDREQRDRRGRLG